MPKALLLQSPPVFLAAAFACEFFAAQLPIVPYSGSAAQKLLACAHSTAAQRIRHVQLVKHFAAERHVRRLPT
jgi:hypothetical protein